MADLKKSCKVLELDKILSLLGKFTHSEEAKDLALNLVPLTDINLVKKMVDETDEAYSMLCRFKSPEFVSLLNPDKNLKSTKAGSLISPSGLLNIAMILRQSRILKVWEEHVEKLGSCIFKYFSEIKSNRYLEDLLFKSILSEDKISDDASDELKRIRISIKNHQQKIRDSLERLIKGSNQKYLQDPIITIRDNRYVVPVKSEYKNEIPGLVHDISASGSTFFVEPSIVVEANNEVRVIIAKEKEEIEKILRDLSLKCLEFADLINKNYKNILILDLIFAKANLAVYMNAATPKLNDRGEIYLKDARHPLIDKNIVVPIDIGIGDRYKGLIITGPNTGGKTVALKTMGLLTLMTMCGLLVPANENSQICIFNKILVDIGDEQSIEHSLSTFSAHMANIVSILKTVDENSLVLIDELGSGTDPEEGAALAVAIIEQIGKKGACLAATTHYSELKLYALENDNIENACFEFDFNTLKPTYKLLMGVPGQSNAFAISKKIGLSSDLICRAKSLMSGQRNAFDKVIEKLEISRKKYEKELEKQRQSNAKVEKIKKQIEKKLDYTDKQVQEKLEKAQEQAKYIVDSVRSQSNIVLDELSKIKKTKDKGDFNKLLSRANLIAKSKVKNLYDKATPVINRKDEDYKLPRELKVGDTVIIYDINKKGQLVNTADKSGKVLVRMGGMNIRTTLDNLRLVEGEKPKKIKSHIKKSFVSKISRNASTEIDLRGNNVEEALEKLDRFIDTCLLSNIEVITIIHGKGTGVLRGAINKHLKSHPNVSEQRLGVFGEGGDGVTVAVLK